MAFDYDRDGDQDLLVINYLESALLYKNDGGAEQGNWLVVDPIGTAPNMHAIGATVYVEAGGMNQMRFITAGTSWLAQEPDLAHFGVGNATTVDSVRIVWADGTEDTVTDLAVNQYVEILQGIGLPPEPSGDPISLEIAGPGILAEESTQAYTAIAEYENGSSIDVTADATWAVIAGAEYAEFSVVNPGELTALLLADELEMAEVTIQAAFESLVDTLEVSIVESGADVVGPTLAITDPTTEAEMITEESTVTLTGTAEDQSGVMAVVWSTDQGISGPCSGLVIWTTGPIQLTEGVNLITITVRDGLQNAAGAELLVTYVLPEEPSEPDTPEEPDDPETPVEPDSEDPGIPEAPEDRPVSEDPLGEEPTPDSPELNEDQFQDDEADRPPPPTGLCGAIGLIHALLVAAGLALIRRRPR